MPITLFIGAAACPVRQETDRVAEPHAVKGVFLVTTGPDPPVRSAALGATQIGGDATAREGPVHAGRPHGSPDQVRQ